MNQSIINIETAVPTPYLLEGGWIRYSGNTWGNELFTASTFQLDSATYAYHTSENESERDLISHNRKQLLLETGFNGLITLKQIHSEQIHEINADNIKDYLANPLIEGDGLMTNIPNVLLGILTADCLPVFYTDQQHSFLALVHAGWKGIQNKIALKMLQRVVERYQVHMNQIQMLVGPHIQSCCYEVGLDLLDKIPQSPYKNIENRFYLDLKQWLIQDLVEGGLETKQISHCAICTKCHTNPSFYSYRNQHKKERNLSMIGLRSGHF
jgi:YfiH family protein